MKMFLFHLTCIVFLEIINKIGEHPLENTNYKIPMA